MSEEKTSVSLGELNLQVVGVSLQPTCWPPELTGAERDVAAQLVRGRSYAEIARARQCSGATVETHVRSILRKLRVESAAQAIAHLARFQNLGAAPAGSRRA